MEEGWCLRDGEAGLKDGRMEGSRGSKEGNRVEMMREVPTDFISNVDVKPADPPRGRGNVGVKDMSG